MSFGKSFVISFVVFALISGLFFGVYGGLVVSENVVPTNNYPIDMWVKDFQVSGIVSAIGGLLCHMLWYYFGNNKGLSSLTVKYWVLMIVALVMGFAVCYFLAPAAEDGAGLSNVLVIIAGALGYYVSSLFASASAGRRTPPLADIFH